jgi:hypothetical protein
MNITLNEDFYSLLQNSVFFSLFCKFLLQIGHFYFSHCLLQFSQTNFLAILKAFPDVVWELQLTIIKGSLVATITLTFFDLHFGQRKLFFLPLYCYQYIVLPIYLPYDVYHYTRYRLLKKIDYKRKER